MTLFTGRYTPRLPCPTRRPQYSTPALGASPSETHCDDNEQDLSDHLYCYLPAPCSEAGGDQEPEARCAAWSTCASASVAQTASATPRATDAEAQTDAARQGSAIECTHLTFSYLSLPP